MWRPAGGGRLLVEKRAAIDASACVEASERGAAVKSASERIERAMHSISYQQYRYHGSNCTTSGSRAVKPKYVEEVQGPKSTRAMALYDSCTDFKNADRCGRQTVIAAPTETLWLCHPRDHMATTRVSSQTVSSLSPAPDSNFTERQNGGLNRRIKNCSNKQTLKARLLEQVGTLSGVVRLMCEFC
jgi:hypothetical protein